MLNQNKGFTIIELLVSILISSILASVAILAYMKIVHQCFRNSLSCMNQDPIKLFCEKGKATNAQYPHGPILVQMRYSPKCHTTWPRLEKLSPHDPSFLPVGSKIYVIDGKGRKYGEATIQKSKYEIYNAYYGDMGPGSALGACLELPSGERMCTEEAAIYLELNPEL